MWFIPFKYTHILLSSNALLVEDKHSPAFNHYSSLEPNTIDIPITAPYSYLPDSTCREEKQSEWQNKLKSIENCNDGEILKF